MVKQKRGLGFGMAILITLLVIVVSMFVFSPLVDFVINFIRTGGEASACALSIFGGRGIAVCPIDDVKVSYDKVEIKYGGQEKKEYETFLEKGSRTEDEMVKEALARLLQSCLHKGGGLNSRAFGDGEIFRESMICLECATLTADQWSTGADDILTNGLEGLGDYLINTPAQGKISDKTYMDILTRNYEHKAAYIEGGSDGGAKLFPGFTTTSPNKDYVIFYLGIKDGKDIPVLGAVKNTWKAMHGNFKGILEDAFKSRGVYFTYITESSNLRNICQRKVN